jgi:hypothetical protein
VRAKLWQLLNVIVFISIFDCPNMEQVQATRRNPLHYLFVGQTFKKASSVHIVWRAIVVQHDHDLRLGLVPSILAPDRLLTCAIC